MYANFINKIWVISWCNRNYGRNQFFTHLAGSSFCSSIILRAWRKKDLEEVPPVLASGKSQNQRVAIVVSVVSVGGQCNLDWWKKHAYLMKIKEETCSTRCASACNMNHPWGHLYGEFGECDALSCACTMDLYEQRWEHARHLPLFSVNSSMSSFDWVETHGEVVCLPCKHLAICSFCSKYLGLFIRHAQGEDPGENMVGNVGFIWAVDRSFRSCIQKCYRTSWKKAEVGLCFRSCLEGIRGVLNKYHLHLHHITSTAFHRRVWNFNTLASIWKQA